MGIDNIMNFDFMSPPPSANMIRALEVLATDSDYIHFVDFILFGSFRR